MKSKILYIIYLLFFVSWPVIGQANHDSIEKLINGKVNDSGSALTYFISKNGIVYLNLYHTKSGELTQFRDIHSEIVLNDKIWLGWKSAERTLYKVDLKTGIKEVLPTVDRYEWFPEKSLILVFDKIKKTLQLRDENFKTIYIISDVHSYEVSPEQKQILVLLEDNRVELVNLDARKVSISKVKLRFPTKEVKKIKWNPFEEYFYLFSTNTEMLTVYRLADNDLKQVGETSLIDTRNSYVDTSFRNLEFIDKKTVIFGVKALTKPNNNVSQVWIGSSKGITPVIEKAYTNNLQAAVMNLTTGTKISLFEVGKIKVFKIHPYSRAIYSYEKNELEDFTKQFAPIKVYQYDLDNRQKELLGEFRGHSSYFVNSGLTTDLFYFKDNEWFVYDGKRKEHTHLTRGMRHKFYDDRNEFLDGTDFIPNQQLPSYQGQWIIFESTSDIWFYDPMSRKFKQKTNGVSQKRSYSLTTSSTDPTYNTLYWSANVKTRSNNLLLNWQSDDLESEGLSLLKENGKIQDLIQDKAKFSQAVQSQRFVTYVKENADRPPALYILNKDLRREILVYQSNKNDTVVSQTKYITWVNEEGQCRGAVVRFPKKYDSTLKYPAVVNIYQKKYMLRHKYVNAFQLESGSINYRRYTEDGYFVIEPDIYYELGATGQSAYSCVNTAVDQVLLHTSIDPNRIGIIGHSFGGYQTNFILTQTNRFKAAVSSSSVFDLESFYLTINWETLKPDMWRMENQQFRMGKGMYEDRDLYRNNSPSVFIENVTTPILIVTGGQDYQVNYQQSFMMFLALKRLNKEVNLLLYPEEAHTIRELNARKDYNIKIKEWFDYKLKEVEKPKWLKEGLY